VNFSKCIYFLNFVVSSFNHLNIRWCCYISQFRNNVLCAIVIWWKILTFTWLWPIIEAETCCTLYNKYFPITDLTDVFSNPVIYFRITVLTDVSSNPVIYFQITVLKDVFLIPSSFFPITVLTDVSSNPVIYFPITVLTDVSSNPVIYFPITVLKDVFSNPVIYFSNYSFNGRFF